jgi:hypothetical protein
MVWRTTWRAVAFGVAGGVVILTLLLVSVVVLNAVGAGDWGTDWAGSLYLGLLYYLAAVMVGAVVGVGAGAGSAVVLACQRPLQGGGCGSLERLVFAVAGGVGAVAALGLILWRTGATGGGTGAWFAAVVGTITTLVAWSRWPAVTRSPKRGAFEHS